jgi:hypothetical protein
LKTRLDWASNQSVLALEKAAAARSTGLRPIHFSNRAETATRPSTSYGDKHYQFVISGKPKCFRIAVCTMEERKMDVKTTKAVLGGNGLSPQKEKMTPMANGVTRSSSETNGKESGFEADPNGKCLS